MTVSLATLISGGGGGNGVICTINTQLRKASNYYRQEIIRTMIYDSGYYLELGNLSRILKPGISNAAILYKVYKTVRVWSTYIGHLVKSLHFV